MPKPIVVTGGAGYIGSVLTQYLLGQGFNVRVLDTLAYTAVGLLPILDNKGLTLIRGDIRDPVAVATALDGAGSVIHLAAIANDPSGDLDPGLTYDVNLAAYPPLLIAAKKAGVDRFINASSFSVYGFETEPNIDETHALRPLKAYSIAKAGAEAVVTSHNSPNFVTTNLRLATVCGWSPRMRFDLIVNMLTGIALNTGELTIWGGAQKRPQIHIQDLIQAISLTLNAPPWAVGGETFNIGGENASIAHIAQQIQQEVEGVTLTFEDARSDERSYDVSWEKARRVLGFTPRRPIVSAIRDIQTAFKRGSFDNSQDVIFHNIRQMNDVKHQSMMGA